MKTLYSLFVLTVCVGLMGCNMKQDSGTWKGSVVVRDGIRAPYTCELEIDITHTDEMLIVHHIESDCDAYETKWHVGTYDIAGISLWKNGRVVGQALEDGTVNISLDDYVMDERYPFPAQRVSLSWNRMGSILNFEQETYSGGRVQRTSGWLDRYH